MRNSRLLFSVSIGMLLGILLIGCQPIRLVEDVPTAEVLEDLPGAELRVSDFEVIDLVPPEELVSLSTTGATCNPDTKPNDPRCYLCKPCSYYACVNGRWTRIWWEDLWEDEPLCNPSKGSGGPEACSRDEGGFCPPECRICY